MDHIGICEDFPLFPVVLEDFVGRVDAVFIISCQPYGGLKVVPVHERFIAEKYEMHSPPSFHNPALDLISLQNPFQPLCVSAVIDIHQHHIVFQDSRIARTLLGFFQSQERFSVFEWLHGVLVAIHLDVTFVEVIIHLCTTSTVQSP